MDAWSTTYAQVLQQFHGTKPSRELILDSENGLASRLEEICRRRCVLTAFGRIKVVHSKLLCSRDISIEDASINANERDTSYDELEALRLEKNTWTLLGTLYTYRSETPAVGSSAGEIIAKNPYTPPHTLASRIVESSPLLNELQVVENWLQDIAPLPQQSEHRPIYRMYTKRRIQQSRRAGRPGTDNLVTQLDPDVLNRESGTLDSEDMAFEKALAFTLFSHVRSGRLDEAFVICRESDQPWLAAALRGCIMFHWAPITSREQDEEGSSMQEEISEAIQGNKRQKLWRETCQRSSSNPLFSPAMRALLASLCPTPRTFPALLPLMRTWEDHLWARVNMLQQERIWACLESLGGFWMNGMSLKQRVTAGDEAESPAVSGEAEWSHEVRKTLAELEQVKVDQGSDYRHPIHFAQLHIICNRTDNLFVEFAQKVRGGLKEQTDKRLYALIVRFYVHLCLFLRLLEYNVPLLAADTIIEAYVEVLEEQGHGHLVALYVGALSQSAVTRYAAYLSTLGMHTSKQERVGALNRAREHGLDVNEVALATAASIAQQTFGLLPRNEGSLPSADAFAKDLSTEEVTLIRSTEWLTYQPDTYLEALIQSNNMMRYFLGMGRISAAKELAEIIPFEAIQQTHPGLGSWEHGSYVKFLKIWDLFLHLPRVEEFPADAPPVKRSEWTSAYSNSLSYLADQVLELLKSSWLADDQDAVLDERKLNELERIRCIYIPEMVLRLQHVLHESSKIVPGSLYRALELVRVLADSKFNVYSGFVSQHGNRMKEYLEGVRRVALALLEEGRGVADIFGPKS
ncbi:Nucleoporin nup84 [Tulasnella sp. 418]|nr:Nucleoporin nup84 [Tulasnella sp. 418]